MNQSIDSGSDNSAPTAVLLSLQRERQHYASAPDRFLAAWEKAIEKIGPHYFLIQGIDHYTEATHRDQLRPDTTAIEQRLGVCSVGEGVFIGAVMSFYNGDWGAEICTGFGYSGIGDIANRLDLELLTIIQELMINHTGW